MAEASKELENIYYYSRSLTLCHSEKRKRRGILFVKDFSLPLEMTKLDESSQCLSASVPLTCRKSYFLQKYRSGGINRFLRDCQKLNLQKTETLNFGGNFRGPSSGA